jgi:hypothetical protein
VSTSERERSEDLRAMDARPCARGIDPALEGLGPYQRGAAGRKGGIVGARTRLRVRSPARLRSARRLQLGRGGARRKQPPRRLQRSSMQRALGRGVESPLQHPNRAQSGARVGRASASAALERVTTDRTAGSQCARRRRRDACAAVGGSWSTAQPCLHIGRTAKAGARRSPRGSQSTPGERPTTPNRHPRDTERSARWTPRDPYGTRGRDRRGNLRATLTVHTRRVRCSSIPVRDDPVGRRTAIRARAHGPPPRARLPPRPRTLRRPA